MAPSKVYKSMQVIAAASAFLTLLLLSFRTSEDREPSYTYIGDDYPELFPIPEVQDVLMTVEESVHYQLEGLDGRYNWAFIEPIGAGYIRLGPNHRIFAYAMGHQLHCLHMLRISLADPMHKLASLEHSKHCLDYIRQWVLCNPDLTLEPYDPLIRDFSVSRVGATHVCKDWSAVYSAVARNKDEWMASVNNSSTSRV